MSSVRERLLNLLYEFVKSDLPETLQREFRSDIVFKLPHVIDILGARRSGKTYIMYNLMKYLLRRGVEKRRILYADLEHKDLEGIASEDLDAFLNYIAHENIWDEAYLFIDEVHVACFWEHWVRTVYDQYKGKVKIVTSGSTSKLLRPEVAGILTGRHITLEIFPLSFREFLTFRNVNVDKILGKPVITPSESYLLESMLLEYMEFGGFPEVVLAESKEEKLQILSNYYEDIIYRDIVERFKIRNIRAMRLFFRFIVSNIAKYFSYRRAKNFLASVGLKVSTSTLERWCDILEEIYILFLAPVLTKKLTVETRHPRKIYIIDIGLRRVVLRRDIDRGYLLENMVFLEVRRRIKRVRQEIRYWAENTKEVDIVVVDSGDPIIAIQVAESVVDPETRRREVKSLMKLVSRTGIEKAFIVTLGEREKITTRSGEIEVIPYWEFALRRVDEIFSE